jgi:hypothetical protein
MGRNKPLLPRAKKNRTSLLLRAYRKESSLTRTYAELWALLVMLKENMANKRLTKTSNVQSTMLIRNGSYRLTMMMLSSKL